MTKSQFEGEIDLNVYLAAPLSNSYFDQHFTLENMHLATKLEFQRHHGELGFTRVAAEIGNKVDLKITQKSAPPAEPAD